MSRLVDWYFTALKYMVIFFIGSMVLLVFSNVVLRYAFNSGVTVSEELSRWAFVWLTYTAAIVALRENTHLGMDTLVSRLPPLGKKICYILSHLLMLFCVGLFCMGSWEQAVINYGTEAPASGLSAGIFFYGAGIFFSIPAALILLNNLYLALTNQLKDDELVSIKESEEDMDEAKLKELQQEMERETARLAAAGK
jgi:TRAP-type C4-dicarboxylate transport system permease small subunit